MAATVAAFAGGALGVAGPPRRRTVVEVIHRVDGVLAMDQVVVMGAERVLEAGPPRELARRAAASLPGCCRRKGLQQYHSFNLVFFPISSEFQ